MPPPARPPTPACPPCSPSTRWRPPVRGWSPGRPPPPRPRSGQSFPRILSLLASRSNGGSCRRRNLRPAPAGGTAAVAAGCDAVADDRGGGGGCCRHRRHSGRPSVRWAWIAHCRCWLRRGGAGGVGGWRVRKAVAGGDGRCC
jgi:hypothetical protein